MMILNYLSPNTKNSGDFQKSPEFAVMQKDMTDREFADLTRTSRE